MIQRPLELGFDIVLHSATKYLNGHSDIVAGAVVVRDAELAERIGFLQNSAGAVLDPYPLSSLCAAENAGAADGAAFRQRTRSSRHLEGNRKIKRVIYPGLKAIPSTPSPSGRCRASAASSPSTWTRTKRYQALPRRLAAVYAGGKPGGRGEPGGAPFTMSHGSIPANGGPRWASAGGWCGFGGDRGC